MSRRINRALEKNRRQLDELQAERKRQRQAALEQACLLSQTPSNQMQSHDGQPSDASAQEQAINPAAAPPKMGSFFRVRKSSAQYASDRV